jgi:hypothetical protein
VSDDVALWFYVGVLWLATLGIMAPRRSTSIVCRRSKQLAAVTFVALLIDSATRMNVGS